MRLLRWDALQDDCSRNRKQGVVKHWGFVALCTAASFQSGKTSLKILRLIIVISWTELITVVIITIINEAFYRYLGNYDLRNCCQMHHIQRKVLLLLLLCALLIPVSPPRTSVLSNSFGQSAFLRRRAMVYRHLQRSAYSRLNDSVPIRKEC